MHSVWVFIWMNYMNHVENKSTRTTGKIMELSNRQHSSIELPLYHWNDAGNTW